MEAAAHPVRGSGREFWQFRCPATALLRARCYKRAAMNAPPPRSRGRKPPALDPSTCQKSPRPPERLFCAQNPPARSRSGLDQSNRPRLVGLDCDLRRGRQLQHFRALAFTQTREQHDLAAREFQRVMMDVRLIVIDLA